MHGSRSRALVLVLLIAACSDRQSQLPEPFTIAAPEPEPEPEPPREDPPHIVQLPSVELEPVFELRECGAITDLVPLDGRIYGVANGGATACAFDLDERGDELRFDRLQIGDELIDGVTTQLVEAGGVQTIAALWWGGSPAQTQLGLFERTRAGLASLRSEPAHGERSPAGLGLVRDRMGNPLVAYTAQSTILGCSIDPARDVTELMLWTPLTQGHESAAGHYIDRAAASEHGIVLAGVTDFQPNDSYHELECRHLIEIGSLGPTGADWWSDAKASSDEAKAASVLDVIPLGDHWLVLAECDHKAWVASLSAKDGEVAWQADVGTAGRGRLVASPDGGVELVLYVHLRSDRRLLTRRHVGADGTLGPERVVQLELDGQTRVRTLALTGSSRVWLGGVRDDHAWLGFVEFP